MQGILETERIYLREMTDEDFDDLAKVIHGRDGLAPSEAYVHKWIDWCKSSYAVNGFGHYAVVLKSTGEMIGSAGISMQWIDDAWRPEIGYHLRKDYHRQGLGKEMAAAIRDYYFSHFEGDDIYSYMDQDNLASYKTAESIGMSYLHLYVAKDGSLCRVYRLTREEWEKKYSV